MCGCVRRIEGSLCAFKCCKRFIEGLIEGRRESGRELLRVVLLMVGGG